MTFLNWMMLIGLAAVAIPILIHLLNRSRARIVDWGAMRFLMASLASRSRRIMIEEVVLMVLRCLVVLLAVFALARPFLPTRPTALVLLIVPAAVAAAICATLSAAMWNERRLRNALLAGATVLLLLPVVAGGLEQAYQSSRWSFGGGEKDVAIVIDSSASMTLSHGGKTNFQRAVDEARAVVRSCQPADGISLILAGSAPRAAIGSPSADRKKLAAALEEASPAGGTMQVVRALQMASSALAEGANPARKIVLITDGQHLGWDVRKDARWRFLGTALSHHPTPPQLIVRTLAVPEKFTNAAITDLSFDRKVIGTDREVRIDVKVASTGTEPSEAQVVKLFVDGKEAGSHEVDKILPNSAETAQIKYRFRQPGRHIVAARVSAGDDLPGDDSAERVVDVLRTLPVLIVNGAASPGPLESAADFVAVALAPPEAKDERDKQRTAEEQGCLVDAKVTAAADLGDPKDLDRYALLVLADVPLLPKVAAERIARYVREGGGLLVAPARGAQEKFYNTWVDETGQAVLPGKLVRFQLVEDKPAHLSLDSFRHEALTKIADAARSDARLAVVTAYWQASVAASDRQVSVAALLDNGDPLLLERRLGKGRVLLSSVSLHPRSSNLPVLKCFVPLMHELAYYLAGSSMVMPNIEPGSDLTVELEADSEAGQTPGTGLKGEYFDDKEFRALKATRLDAGIDFNWADKPGHPAVRPDGFCVRWTGKVMPRYTEAYTFTTTSDDGVRLWIDGQKIIDDWKSHGVGDHEGRANLTAGRMHEIRLEYYDDSGEAAVKLAWSSTSQKRQIVPASRLYSDVTGSAIAKGDEVEVVAPSQRRQLATVVQPAGPLRISFLQTHEPGLYRLILPQAVRGLYSAMAPDGKGVPFVVTSPPEESTLTPLSEADLSTARESLLATLEGADPTKTLARVETTGELTAAVAGGIPGRELWQFVALLLLGALLAEIALARWIAIQRKANAIEPVAFASDLADLQSFRQKAKDLVAVPAEPQTQDAARK